MTKPLVIKGGESEALTSVFGPVLRLAPEDIVISSDSRTFAEASHPGIEVRQDPSDLAKRIADWRAEARRAAEDDPDWDVSAIQPLCLRQPPACD